MEGKHSVVPIFTSQCCCWSSRCRKAGEIKPGTALQTSGQGLRPTAEQCGQGQACFVLLVSVFFCYSFDSSSLEIGGVEEGHSNTETLPALKDRPTKIYCQHTRASLAEAHFQMFPPFPHPGNEGLLQVC